MRKLWGYLTRPGVTRRSFFAGAAAGLASGLGGRWLSDELSRTGAAPAAPPPANAGPGFIDVAEFKKTMSVEQLNKTAEGYFAGVANRDFFLSKPFGQVEDCTALLNNVSHLMSGLQLLPGMTVLDFGAASCWLTRWMTQLGMRAIALDVSETALKIGKELYQRLPVIGERPPPRFLLFDGYRIDLPDASVDRIVVLDVFHHLLNPGQVLKEMARVLKPGGIAGFSEPGPNHSRSPGAQAEMRHYSVLEDDVDIRRVWQLAQAAGFARIRLAVMSSQPLLLPLPEFEDYLQGGAANGTFANITRAQMQERRMFFLHRTAQPQVFDSRAPAGLAASLQVTPVAQSVKEGEPLVARVVAKNSGRATWLPGSTASGGVNFGCHLLDASGRMLKLEYYVQPFAPGKGRPVAPGESVEFEARIPSPAKGRYLVECDLASSGVIWFGNLGSETVRLPLQVN